MDDSMWSHHAFAASYGKVETRGSAARQYYDEITKPEHDGRFGLLHKGHRDQREGDLETLSGMWGHNQLWIDRGCVNTWNEIEGAVRFLDVRTGWVDELINPPGKKPKPCPDHALHCLIYGTIHRTPVSTEPEDTSLPADYDDARGKQVQAMRETLDKSRLAAIKAERPPNWLRRF